MTKRYVLDACALIAFLRKEEGSEKVLDLLNEVILERSVVYMHSANIAEVYYDFCKFGGQPIADKMLADITVMPLEINREIKDDMIKLIGYFKSNYRISFADSFVLATAKLHDAIIVTSDHDEFGAIDNKEEMNFLWLR